jgi:hypothetical protein
MRIGIDFDNTLVDYDQVFAAEARGRDLIGADFKGSKRQLRDHIRNLPGGEIAWQRLQGHVYGAGICAARMFEGADAFLTACRTRGIEVFVVSHKTQFGHGPSGGINLRTAALAWMTSQGFFSGSGFHIPPDHVFFESTRAEKLARIRAIDCGYFIDDLEEVFADRDFPAGVYPILFATTGNLMTGAVCPSWREITALLFDNGR